MLSKNLHLNLNNSKSVIVACGLFLQNWYKLLNVFEQLSLYSFKSYVTITMSRFFALSACVSFISVMQLVNGDQLLNIAGLLFVSSALAASSAPAPTTVIVLLTSIYALLK